MPIVDGIENFVGNIKRLYRQRGPVSDNPGEHHWRFYETNRTDSVLVDHGVVPEPKWQHLVDCWEQDSRLLFADPVWLTNGCVSYMLYERRRK